MGAERLFANGVGYDAPPLIDVLLRRPAWHADAACRDHPELSWFPGRGEPLDQPRAVCAGCLVRDECLAAALEDPAMHGVRAGTSERERRLLRRGPRAAAA